MLPFFILHFFIQYLFFFFFFLLPFTFTSCLTIDFFGLQLIVNFYPHQDSTPPVFVLYRVSFSLSFLLFLLLLLLFFDNPNRCFTVSRSSNLYYQTDVSFDHSEWSGRRLPYYLPSAGKA